MPESERTRLRDLFRMRSKGGGVTRWAIVEPITVTEIHRVPAGWLLTVEGAPEKLQLYSGNTPQWETPLDA